MFFLIVAQQSPGSPIQVQYLNKWRLPMLTFSSQIFLTCIMLCLTKSIQKFMCSTTRGTKYGDQQHYKKITNCQDYVCHNHSSLRGEKERRNHGCYYGVIDDLKTREPYQLFYLYTSCLMLSMCCPHVSNMTVVIC